MEDRKNRTYRIVNLLLALVFDKSNAAALKIISEKEYCNNKEQYQQTMNLIEKLFFGGK